MKPGEKKKRTLSVFCKPKNSERLPFGMRHPRPFDSISNMNQRGNKIQEVNHQTRKILLTCNDVPSTYDSSETSISSRN